MASGAGVHAAHCAPQLPHIRWQPTDMLAEVLPTIDANAAAAAAAAAAANAGGQANVAGAQELDLVRSESWEAPLAALRAHGPVVAVLAVNVTHISPWSATLGLLSLAGEALAADGRLCVYGPFSFAGVIEPESNRTFDASLRSRNAEWGYRDVEAVEKAASACGLRLLETIAMPANNHFLIFGK